MDAAVKQRQHPLWLCRSMYIDLHEVKLHLELVQAPNEASILFGPNSVGPNNSVTLRGIYYRLVDMIADNTRKVTIPKLHLEL